MKALFPTSLFRGALATAVTVSLTMSGVASAQTVPDDAEFESAEIVGVQPVLVTGASPEAAWAEVSGFLASPQARKTAAAPASLPKLTGDSGFGFAGKAAAADIRVLRHAVLVGVYAGLVAQGDGNDKLRHTLIGSVDTVYASLTPGAKGAVAKLLQRLANGKFDSAAIAATFRAAEAGIADGPQRAHGYLAAGLWAGLATMVAGIDGDRGPFVTMAGPLMVLLREDAEFGGADKTIARHMEVMSGLLGNKSPESSKILDLADQILKVNPDK